MAEGIVSSVLQTPASSKERQLKNDAQFGERDKVEDAKRELRMMRSFLKDADAKAGGGDERLRDWVLEITEAAYDLEDVVAAFVLKEEAAATKGMVMRFACLFKRPIELHKVGSKIDGISNRISKLTRSLETYGVKMSGESSSNQRLKELRQAYSHVPDHVFVGFGKNIKDLVEHLTNPASGIVSICGMGGLARPHLQERFVVEVKSKLTSIALLGCMSLNNFNQKKFWKKYSLTFFLPRITEGKKLKLCQRMH